MFLTIPNYFAITIKEHETENNSTIYIIGASEVAMAHNRLLERLNIWLYSFVLKVIPCCVLTSFTGFLIWALMKAEERSARLKQNGNGGGGSGSGNHRRISGGTESTAASHFAGGGSIRHSTINGHGGHPGHAGSMMSKASTSRKRSTDRTTRLLIAILIMFLVTEFPQVCMLLTLYISSIWVVGICPHTQHRAFWACCPPSSAATS